MILEYRERAKKMRVLIHSQHGTVVSDGEREESANARVQSRSWQMIYRIISL